MNLHTMLAAMLAASATLALGCATTPGSHGNGLDPSSVVELLGTGAQIFGTIYVLDKADDMYEDMARQTREMVEVLGTANQTDWNW